MANFLLHFLLLHYIFLLLLHHLFPCFLHPHVLLLFSSPFSNLPPPIP